MRPMRPRLGRTVAVRTSTPPLPCATLRDVGTALTVYEAEKLREPVLVVGYAGWNDGGDAASTAAKSLLEQFSMSRYACIDTEEYLDFTVVRPQVRIRDGDQREIVWPDHEFFAARLAASDSDLLVGLGVEPHLRWKSYLTLHRPCQRRHRRFQGGSESDAWADGRFRAAACQRESSSRA